MALTLTLAFSCLVSLLSHSHSQSTYTCSRATYYGSPEFSGTASGACGYGEFGRDLNGGDVGAVARLYRNGTGCGACYQVRCSNPELCREEGVKIVVTDHGEGDYTDFIMSARGFLKLAKPNMAAELMAYGVIDIEYRRYATIIALHRTPNSTWFTDVVFLDTGSHASIQATT